FQSIKVFNLDTSQDELEVYLAAPPDTTCLDAIAHWTAARCSESCLALMVLDYLSAPVTSVDVEHAFSHGRLTVSRLHHSLGDESMQSATVLGSWDGIPGLILEKEIITAFKEKSSRVK
ncbi:hypothetical protein M422DRAFT_92102, partial [Sphaerobolus stellatus SS14]